MLSVSPFPPAPARSDLIWNVRSDRSGSQTKLPSICLLYTTFFFVFPGQRELVVPVSSGVCETEARPTLVQVTSPTTGTRRDKQPVTLTPRHNLEVNKASHSFIF